MLFKKKTKTETYDPSQKKPVIRVSICTGEQVAGFRDLQTGKFSEAMLIKDSRDMDMFKTAYGIQGEIEKFY